MGELRCGTVPGYERHRRRGEVPCAGCRAANAAAKLVTYHARVHSRCVRCGYRLGALGHQVECAPEPMVAS